MTTLMNARCITITVLLMLTALAAAQKQKTARIPQTISEATGDQERIGRLAMNTERIMFIDSIVVGKKDFLTHYSLNPEVGIIDTYSHYFHQDRQPNSYVFVNELANKCYLSLEDNKGIISLYYSEMINQKWTRPRLLHGINESHKFKRINYPFMMGDGQTLYFAAEGAEGLGGYDIYMTTYDADSQRFLQPVSIGMPFNSKANDYMYVIDEYDSLGWFATDRNQPEDKVCIYIFQPSDVRRTYNPEEFTPDDIARYARIESITATWEDKQLLDQALTRLHKSILRKQKKNNEHEFHFVINDDITYLHLSDFRAPGNAKQYQHLVHLYARYLALQDKLNGVRDYYVTAGKEERRELDEEIQASEKKSLELLREIHQLSKDIRNAENIFLTKN